MTKQKQCCWAEGEDTSAFATKNNGLGAERNHLPPLLATSGNEYLRHIF
ncbi:hypothetical protein [Polaromonas sp. CG_9.11]|nr:hypothetical protein [Polaromonas sp. CG_9.11]